MKHQTLRLLQFLDQIEQIAAKRVDYEILELVEQCREDLYDQEHEHEPLPQ